MNYWPEPASVLGFIYAQDLHLARDAISFNFY